MLFTVTLGLASLVYYVEPQSSIATLADTLWFVMTIVNVGYGIFTLELTLRHSFIVFFVLLIVISALRLANPSGIVGSALDRVWEDKGWF